MKKRICLYVVSLFSIIGFNTAKAQITTALSANNNYTGIMSSLLNPAAPANSRVGFELNLFTMQTGFANDAYQTTFSNMFKSELYDNPVKDVNYFRTKNTETRAASVNFDILGPSIQLSLSDHSAATLYTRLRTMVNGGGINSALLDIAENEFQDNVLYKLGSPRFSSHAFGEVALSYAHAFTKNPQHVFKVGLTGKYISGMGALVNHMDNVIVEYDNTGDKFTTLQAKTHSLFSAGFGNISLDDPTLDNIFQAIGDNVSKGSGIGADIGFQYEYRPQGRALDYKTDKGRLSRHDNPYMFKLGMSLLDIGSVSYKTGTPSGDYRLNADGKATAIFNTQAGETIQQYISRLQNTENVLVATPIDKFTMSLPTTLNINADYHPFGNLYVGAGAMINLIDKKSISKNATYYESVYQLTPRLESRRFTLFVPMSFDVVRQFTAGVGVQLGPLTLGSNSVLSNSSSTKKIRNLDFFAGLSFRFYKKRYNLVKPIEIHDTTIIRQHTTDTLLVTKDRDGDGIVDDKDECPDVPGLLALNGCPDQDGDGIPDYKDSCVTVPGVAKYNGCPIPDRDGDGINDDEDKCPDVPGLARYQGCPIPDRDNDGVNDEEDKCPDVPGTVANFGCPEIKAEVIEKFKKAAGKIYFATGKFNVLAKSFPALNIVVAELKKDSTLRLEIQGHTDNVGKPANNMILSDKRAASVKAYLVKKGIDPARLKSHGYGDSKPVQPNKTAAGRAKNRRTEFNLSNYDAPTDAPVTK